MLYLSSLVPLRHRMKLKVYEKVVLRLTWCPDSRIAFTDESNR
jgi:hypothetical protein